VHPWCRILDLNLEGLPDRREVLHWLCRLDEFGQAARPSVEYKHPPLPSSNSSSSTEKKKQTHTAPHRTPTISHGMRMMSWPGHCKQNKIDSCKGRRGQEESETQTYHYKEKKIASRGLMYSWLMWRCM
jgi:hypothetical protein